MADSWSTLSKNKQQRSDSTALLLFSPGGDTAPAVSLQKFANYNAIICKHNRFIHTGTSTLDFFCELVYTVFWNVHFSTLFLKYDSHFMEVML